MNRRQFEEILKSGEGAMIEFKKSVSSSLGREISAFANTAGGRIFIEKGDRPEPKSLLFTTKYAEITKRRRQ